LFAGRQQHLPRLVGDAHEDQHAAARLQVLLGGIGALAGELIAQGGERRRKHAFDRNEAALDAERARLRGRILEAHGGGVARGHHHRVHAFGADGIHGNRQRQRRVDAARESHDDAGKIMFHDVVAHAQNERAIHALLIGELRGDGRGERHHATRRIAREFRKVRALEKRGRPCHDDSVRVHAE